MQEKAWETDYYKETDRRKRKAILDQAIEEEGMTPANELRVKLYEARYGMTADGEREIDYFIRGWMTLEYVKSTSKWNFFAGKRLQKERASVLKDWQCELALSYGETGEDVICREYCNLTALYLELCKNDHTYGSIAFGIGTMKFSSFKKKLADDIFRVAYVIPEQIGAKEDLRLFTKAASVTFCLAYPEMTDDFYERVKNL